MVHDELDAIKVCSDDDRSVADAGVLLAATLARRLGIEALVNEWIIVRAVVGVARGDLGGRRTTAFPDPRRDARPRRPGRSCVATSRRSSRRRESPRR